MGMFDEIAYKGHTYQSKDFCCLMEQYAIEDDVLYRIAYDRINEGVLFIRDRWNTDYSGPLNFYRIGLGEEWIEFNAQFKDGRLVSEPQREGAGDV